MLINWFDWRKEGVDETVPASFYRVVKLSLYFYSLLSMRFFEFFFSFFMFCLITIFKFDYEFIICFRLFLLISRWYYDDENIFLSSFCWSEYSFNFYSFFIMISLNLYFYSWFWYLSSSLFELSGLKEVDYLVWFI